MANPRNKAMAVMVSIPATSKVRGVSMMESGSGLLPRRWFLWGVAGLVFLVGVYFRVVGLNDTTLHADACIHDVCKAGVTPVDIMVKWEQMLGRTSQMATPAAFTKLFLDVFHLPPTRGNVILPSAIWGILAILAALWVGWRLGGAWFGLLLMAVVAFNPMHVQMSRMAYFYPPCLLGGFLMLWCLMESWDHMKDGRRLRWTFHMVHAGAIVFLIYSSASAWPLTVFLGLFHIVCSSIRWRRGVVSFNEVILLGATYVVLGIPLLFFSWGVPALLSMTGQNEATAYWRRIFELGRATPVLTIVSQEFSKLGWGWTPVRAVVTGVVAAIGSLMLAIRMRKDARWGMSVVVFVVGIALSVMAMKSSTLPFGLRRVAAVWPFGFVILAAGLSAPWLMDAALPDEKRLWGHRLLQKWRWVIRWVWGAMGVVLFGLWISADIRVLKVDGFPVPYRQIGQWLDSRFPKGTPVVTDRFYTAMCEFNQSDPTTNVVVISTVMNELPEIQEKTRFRDVTQHYFEENPDAMFYCSGHMYERPEVVPWEWSVKYFRQKQVMRDDAAGTLGMIGQNYHAGYPGFTNWPVVYYNTETDIVAIKKTAGAAGFVMWGPDWRPVQTQDYRLWRLLLAGDAGLKVYSLGENEQELALELTGVAVGGEQRVQVGDQAMTFPANQIVQHRVKVKVQPGMNVVPVRSRGVANARLLIAKAEVK